MLAVGSAVNLEVELTAACQALSTKHGLDPVPSLVQNLAYFHPVEKI